MAESDLNISFNREKLDELDSRFKDITSDQQEALSQLQTREMTVKSRGVTLTIYGNYRLKSVSISQDFFETASKQTLEKAIFDAYNNAYNSIRNEADDINVRAKNKMEELLKEVPTLNGSN